jgi:hypothetical protein
MDRLISFFTTNWQQKSVAFTMGLLIWLFVNTSLTETKILPNVAIKVTNLPEDKTIVGIMPNGLLNKRITLTVMGPKKLVDELEPGDLEVVINASQFDQDEQVLRITRKNLVSLNPSLDIDSISDISHSEFVLKLSKLITAKVPIHVIPPKGLSPQGYVYLDIWPQRLTQTITGPEEQVEALMSKGFELPIDYAQISKADLDRIKTSRENYHDDEVSFFIPASLKKIAIPFRNNTLEEINDPEAQNLHIDFLRKEMFSLERELPVQIFYPLITSDFMNPSTLALDPGNTLKVKNNLTYLPLKLYVKDVSRLFLEVIRDSLVISIVAEKDKAELGWGLTVIAPQVLENKYVNHLISNHNEGKSSEPRHSKKRDSHLRTRFRDFLQKLTLYISPDKKLDIQAKVEGGKVKVVPLQVTVSENAAR